MSFHNRNEVFHTEIFLWNWACCSCWGPDLQVQGCPWWASPLLELLFRLKTVCDQFYYFTSVKFIPIIYIFLLWDVWIIHFKFICHISWLIFSIKFRGCVVSLEVIVEASYFSAHTWGSKSFSYILFFNTFVEQETFI